MATKDWSWDATSGTWQVRTDPGAGGGGSSPELDARLADVEAALAALTTAVGLKAPKDNAVFTGTFAIAPGALALAGLNDLPGYLRDSWGFLPIIWINSVTEAWPSTRVVPSGYGSGPAYLDSSAVANAVTPTIGIDKDRWRRKKPS